MQTRFTAVKAQRLKLKARIGLTGVTNSGKTYTALVIAKGLLQAENLYTSEGKLDWSKVAVIDSERKRVLFYADIPEFGQFTFIDFQPPYHPKYYIEAVKYAKECGAEIIIIDSISHAWNGTGGVLDIVRERTERSKTKNSMMDGWGGAEGGTALQNKMIDEILSVDAHVIATFRQKMDYAVEKDEQGKLKIQKLGVKPQQREDLEYEFDITLKLDSEHNAEIIKNTVKFLNKEGDILAPITEEFGRYLGEYLSSGAPYETILNSQLEDAKKKIKEMVTVKPSLKEIYEMYSKTPLSQETNLELLIEIIRNMKECM